MYLSSVILTTADWIQVIIGWGSGSLRLREVSLWQKGHKGTISFRSAVVPFSQTHIKELTIYRNGYTVRVGWIGSVESECDSAEEVIPHTCHKHTHEHSILDKFAMPNNTTARNEEAGVEVLVWAYLQSNSEEWQVSMILEKMMVAECQKKVIKFPKFVVFYIL